MRFFIFEFLLGFVHILFARSFIFAWLQGYVHVVCRVCFFCIRVCFLHVITKIYVWLKKKQSHINIKVSSNFNVGVVCMAQQMKVLHSVSKVYMVQQNGQ